MSAVGDKRSAEDQADERSAEQSTGDVGDQAGKRSARAIDWGSAEVEAGVLTAPLLGDCPRGWVKRCEAVLKMLDQRNAGWGKIAVGKRRVRVQDVEEGDEHELAHLLESAVLQVNADVFDEDEVAAAPEQQDAEEDAAAARDRRMTAAFRAFGGS